MEFNRKNREKERKRRGLEANTPVNVERAVKNIQLWTNEVSIPSPLWISQSVELSIFRLYRKKTVLERIQWIAGLFKKNDAFAFFSRALRRTSSAR